VTFGGGGDSGGGFFVAVFVTRKRERSLLKFITHVFSAVSSPHLTTRAIRGIGVRANFDYYLKNKRNGWCAVRIHCARRARDAAD
jgi:hypothetical protein